MRVLAWCWIGFIFTLTGCGSHECARAPEAKTKVSAQDCTEDDCCSGVTRAGLLKQSLEKKDDAEESHSK